MMTNSTHHDEQQDQKSWPMANKDRPVVGLTVDEERPQTAKSETTPSRGHHYFHTHNFTQTMYASLRKRMILLSIALMLLTAALGWLPQLRRLPKELVEADASTNSSFQEANDNKSKTSYTAAETASLRSPHSKRQRSWWHRQSSRKRHTSPYRFSTEFFTFPYPQLYAPHLTSQPEETTTTEADLARPNPHNLLLVDDSSSEETDNNNHKPKLFAPSLEDRVPLPLPPPQAKDTKQRKKKDIKKHKDKA
jgi:hypothetical protein